MVVESVSESSLSDVAVEVLEVGGVKVNQIHKDSPSKEKESKDFDLQNNFTSSKVESPNGWVKNDSEKSIEDSSTLVVENPVQECENSSEIPVEKCSSENDFKNEMNSPLSYSKLETETAETVTETTTPTKNNSTPNKIIKSITSPILPKVSAGPLYQIREQIKNRIRKQETILNTEEIQSEYVPNVESLIPAFQFESTIQTKNDIPVEEATIDTNDIPTSLEEVCMDTPIGAMETPGGGNPSMDTVGVSNSKDLHAFHQDTNGTDSWFKESTNATDHSTRHSDSQGFKQESANATDTSTNQSTDFSNNTDSWFQCASNGIGTVLESFSPWRKVYSAEAKLWPVPKGTPKPHSFEEECTTPVTPCTPQTKRFSNYRPTPCPASCTPPTKELCSPCGKIGTRYGSLDRGDSACLNWLSPHVEKEKERVVTLNATQITLRLTTLRAKLAEYERQLNLATETMTPNKLKIVQKKATKAKEELAALEKGDSSYTLQMLFPTEFKFKSLDNEEPLESPVFGRLWRAAAANAIQMPPVSILKVNSNSNKRQLKYDEDGVAKKVRFNLPEDSV
eukprot:Platyproteum_vivax@DN6393_c0_g1_i1.p1